MKTIYIIATVMLLVLSCAPSQAAIQTAIAETQQASPVNQNGNIDIAGLPPKEALEQAFNDLEQRLTELFEGFSFSTIDPANFELHRAQPIPLNKADVLNGISYKWCLGIRWVRHDVEIDTFVQLEHIYLLTLKEGEWSTETISFNRAGYSSVEMDELIWNNSLLS